MSSANISRDDVLKMFDTGDLYGLVLSVGRAWVGKDHPKAQYGLIVVHLGDNVPDAQVPLILSASSPVSGLPPQPLSAD
jgi:hypothetical protein